MVGPNFRIKELWLYTGDSNFSLVLSELNLLPAVDSHQSSKKDNNNNNDETPAVDPLTTINYNNNVSDVQSFIHNDRVEKTFIVNKYFEKQLDSFVSKVIHSNEAIKQLNVLT